MLNERKRKEMKKEGQGNVVKKHKNWEREEEKESSRRR